MKIGILTYHRSHNYGAYMQAYSLSKALNELPKMECELINYNLCSKDNSYRSCVWKRSVHHPDYRKQDLMFEQEQIHLPLSGNLILSDDYRQVLDTIKNSYHIFLVGSDEIWRIGSRGFPNIYWLHQSLQGIKMSYAASSRMRYDALPHDYQKQLMRCYTDFSYIGVRDEVARNEIQKICPKLSVTRNCDPAFLYLKINSKIEIRDKLFKKYGINTDKKIIGIMYDRPSIITKLRSAFGRKYEIVCLYRPMWNADKNLSGLTPFEWVDAIGGCDYFITSYFHGMVFVLMQNTPFVAIDRRTDRQNVAFSKLYDLLNCEKLLNHYYITSELSDNDWTQVTDCTRYILENNAETDYSQYVFNQQKLFNDFRTLCINYAEACNE